MLRVASLFGASNGKSSVDKLALAIRRGDRVRAFADRTVTPSYVYDVAEATVALVERECAVRRCTTASTAARPPGSRWRGRWRRCSAPIPTARSKRVPFASLVAPAPRPQFPTLSNARLAAAGVVLPPWQDALRRAVARMPPA